MTTLPIVRPVVRQLLQSTPAFRELPPERQREVAHDTVRVAAHMADPHGLLSKKRGSRSGAAPAARKPVRSRHAAAAHLSALRDRRVHDAASAASALLQTVDFPDFVADLVHGVFNAILDASIRQMEAYADLVRQVADSVDGFAKDELGDARARHWLAERFAAQLELDARCRLRWRVDAASGRQHVAAALLMPDAAPDLRDLVAAARRRMAHERQQLLASLVMMGINRIVVTDGKTPARARRTRA